MNTTTTTSKLSCVCLSLYIFGWSDSYKYTLCEDGRRRRQLRISFFKNSINVKTLSILLTGCSAFIEQQQQKKSLNSTKKKVEEEKNAHGMWRI